jgi:hypothetical protein
MSPEQEYLLFARRQALQEVQRAAPAVAAMQGIDLECQGPRLSANDALVAAFLATRGEEAPQPYGLLAAIPTRSGDARSRQH